MNHPSQLFHFDSTSSDTSCATYPPSLPHELKFDIPQTTRQNPSIQQNPTKSFQTFAPGCFFIRDNFFENFLDFPGYPLQSMVQAILVV
ncbi:hypothetical protein IAQ61_001124 [Plenodomus lingam]|uniref:uncharacterized protein n=1 Tax=Leptosphaeria maculans TaxID=5022 RepID=UPI0033323B58|nr:hypothetical protein IAQ61_001124 [Plenodomus lingam]